jgi:cytochrome P450
MKSKDDDFRDFDPHRKDIRVAAECLWARMREAPQLPRSEQLGGFRIVSRYRDLKEALLSDKTYSSASGITVPDAHVRTRHIPSEIDPPLHGAYRALMSRFLTGDKVRLMEPGIRALVIELLDAFRERSHVDFVAVFARPLPVHVSLQLLNLPPEDAQRLRDTPKLIDKASEEIVRFASPASYLRRTVTKEVVLGETQLHEGDWVVLAFGAANRDPNVFECPDQVVLDRSPNHHLGFGSGVHRCIGSFLAKLEMRVALEEILRRYREIKLDAAQPIQYSSGLNQGIMALPVILTPA